MPSVLAPLHRRYAPDTLQALVKHIDQQASPSDYNQDANLALLRLAQMEPASVSTQVVAKVLLRALTQLPMTDFRTCVLVMPERLLVRAEKCGWGNS